MEGESCRLVLGYATRERTEPTVLPLPLPPPPSLSHPHRPNPTEEVGDFDLSKYESLSKLPSNILLAVMCSFSPLGMARVASFLSLEEVASCRQVCVTWSHFFSPEALDLWRECAATGASSTKIHEVLPYSSPHWAWTKPIRRLNTEEGVFDAAALLRTAKTYRGLLDSHREIAKCLVDGEYVGESQEDGAEAAAGGDGGDAAAAVAAASAASTAADASTAAAPSVATAESAAETTAAATPPAATSPVPQTKAAGQKHADMLSVINRDVARTFGPREVDVKFPIRVSRIVRAVDEDPSIAESLVGSTDVERVSLTITSKQEHLRNVLVALDLSFPEVGYCQGMVGACLVDRLLFSVARLLTVPPAFSSPQDHVISNILRHFCWREVPAFTLARHLMKTEKHALGQVWRPGLKGLEVCYYQHEALVRDHLPAVHARMKR